MTHNIYLYIFISFPAMSLSPRRAWIEIASCRSPGYSAAVALPSESVD